MGSVGARQMLIEPAPRPEPWNYEISETCGLDVRCEQSTLLPRVAVESSRPYLQVKEKDAARCS